MDHTLLSLVVVDWSAADAPVNPTGLESAVSPWSRHSMLVSVERVVKSAVALELEMGCATQVLSVAAVTVTCTWLDVIPVVLTWYQVEILGSYS